MIGRAVCKTPRNPSLYIFLEWVHCVFVTPILKAIYLRLLWDLRHFDFELLCDSYILAEALQSVTLIVAHVADASDPACRLSSTSSQAAIRASRRAAVGFAGCALRLVPNRGHSALTPDTFGPDGPARSACHENRLCALGGCGRSCCSLHRITAFSPSMAARAMRACGPLAVCAP